MDAFAKPCESARLAGVTAAVQHGLAWLVAGNAIGVMIALLLLLPGLNAVLGEWTYGRWMMVHMNTALFGWCSIPMIALLFKTYQVDGGRLGSWCRPVVWLWSAALLVGSYSWLQGHSSGKLFLDWSGYARVFFPLALLGLWLLLAAAFFRRRHTFTGAGLWARAGGLFALLLVPFVLYFASSPDNYPAFNPQTGGPTGGSQLESTLGIVVILLVLPLGVAPRRPGLRRVATISCAVFALETILTVLLGGSDASHHAPAQYMGLATVLVWAILIPAYYEQFQWNPATRRWRTAFQAWWVGLVITGWILFLPGVLDGAKFTDALVGHSLMAVAGFLSAYILFLMAQVLGERDAWILNRTWSYHAWNMGVLAYVVVMLIAGWLESSNPEWTIVPGTARNVLYVLRLLTGVSMLAGSVEWLAASLSLQSQRAAVAPQARGVKVA